MNKHRSLVHLPSTPHSVYFYSSSLLKVHHPHKDRKQRVSFKECGGGQMCDIFRRWVLGFVQGVSTVPDVGLNGKVHIWPTMVQGHWRWRLPKEDLSSTRQQEKKWKQGLREHRAGRKGHIGYYRAAGIMGKCGLYSMHSANLHACVCVSRRLIVSTVSQKDTSGKIDSTSSSASVSCSRKPWRQ